jgi:hypothetical protein
LGYQLLQISFYKSMLHFLIFLICRFIPRKNSNHGKTFGRKPDSLSFKRIKFKNERFKIHNAGRGNLVKNEEIKQKTQYEPVPVQPVRPYWYSSVTLGKAVNIFGLVEKLFSS